MLLTPYYHYAYSLPHGDGHRLWRKKYPGCKTAILDFLSRHHHYKGVKPFQKGVSEGNEP